MKKILPSFRDERDKIIAVGMIILSMCLVWERRMLWHKTIKPLIIPTKM